MALLMLCLCTHSPEYSWIYNLLTCPCLFLPSNMGKQEVVVGGLLKLYVSLKPVNGNLIQIWSQLSFYSSSFSALSERRLLQLAFQTLF